MQSSVDASDTGIQEGVYRSGPSGKPAAGGVLAESNMYLRIFLMSLALSAFTTVWQIKQ